MSMTHGGSVPVGTLVEELSLRSRHMVGAHNEVAMCQTNETGRPFKGQTVNEKLRTKRVRMLPCQKSQAVTQKGWGQGQR